jgi:hypothetical protein
VDLGHASALRRWAHVALLNATGSTSIVGHPRTTYTLLCGVIAVAACGSSDDHPAMVEVSTATDASMIGAGGEPATDASEILDAPTAPNDSPVMDESHVVDAVSESPDSSLPIDAEPISDGPHLSVQNDAPIDTGLRDAGDAGCAPGCDVGCLTIHDNGVGGTFTDCTALGTYDLVQATLAAHSAANVPGDLMGGLMCGFGPNTSTSLCKIGPTNCACWTYAATGTFVSRIGHATNNTVIQDCLCPTMLDPTWN